MGTAYWHHPGSGADCPGLLVDILTIASWPNLINRLVGTGERSVMNRIAYRRWKDFAVRMARNGWPEEETGAKEHEVVLTAVEHFFERLSWDYEDDVIRIEAWDQTRTNTSRSDQYGHSYTGPYVCDIVSELLSEYNPFYWDDENSPEKHEEWEDEWGARIHCCLRAGLDLASVQSGGVVGFRKSDLLRMYPEGVPKWIKDGKDGWGRGEKAGWKKTDWDNIKEEWELWL